MKRFFYAFLSLLICVFVSCQKDDDAIDNCTFENVGLNGHTVMKATGPNGNYILFPHTGTTKVVDQIYCWTSDLSFVDNHATCYDIDYFWGKASKSWEDRFAGLTIRAVCP